jgi:predicted phage-related endonuclease
MSSVLGLNPWRSAFDVYVAKVAPQEHEGEQVAANEAIELGVALEPWLRDHYATKHDVDVRGSNITYQHLDKPLALATPDGVIYPAAGPHKGWLENAAGVLECKTGGLTGGAWKISKEWGEPGTDEVPQRYLIQVHWQLMVMAGLHPNLEYADLAALIGNLGYREYRILPDADLWGMLYDQAEKFWVDHVLAQMPPEPGPTKDATDALAQLYPSHSEELLESTPEIDKLVTSLHEIQKTTKLAGNISDGFKNQLRAIIAEAYGVAGEWGKAIWTKAKDSEKVDWKAIAASLLDVLTADEQEALLQEHTTVRPGSRTLRTYFKEPFFEEQEADAAVAE